MQPWKKLFVFCKLREGLLSENVEVAKLKNTQSLKSLKSHAIAYQG